MLLKTSSNYTLLFMVSGFVILVVVTPIKSRVHLQKGKGMPLIRSKRGIVWDFVQKTVITKNLISDQFKDTQNTLKNIYNTVNEEFSDPTPAKPTNQPWAQKESLPSFIEEISSSQDTKPDPYTISRYELGRILGRNFRGIQRLAKVELKEAINATFSNLNGYKSEAYQQFANSLAFETKNKLHRSLEDIEG